MPKSILDRNPDFRHGGWVGGIGWWKTYLHQGLNSSLAVPHDAPTGQNNQNHDNKIIK